MFSFYSKIDLEARWAVQNAFIAVPGHGDLLTLLEGVRGTFGLGVELVMEGDPDALEALSVLLLVDQVVEVCLRFHVIHSVIGIAHQTVDYGESGLDEGVVVVAYVEVSVEDLDLREAAEELEFYVFEVFFCLVANLIILLLKYVESDDQRTQINQKNSEKFKISQYYGIWKILNFHQIWYFSA